MRILNKRLTGGHFLTFVCSAFLFAGIFAEPALAQPTITSLGVLSGGNSSYANAISADGMIVAGYGSSSVGTRAFRWSVSGGMQNLGALAGFTTASYGNASSADGAVVTGASYAPGLSSSRAFRWTAATGMQSIGVLGTGSASYGVAISGDGSVIVGSSYVQGFNGATSMRWTAATGMQRLVPLPGGNGDLAFGVSPNGTVVVGTTNVDGYYLPFRWTFSGGLQELDILPGADSAEAHAISADGSAMAGLSGDQFNASYFHAVRWTGLPGSGEIQDLGVLGNGDFSHADAISGDGSVVVGTSTLPDGEHAFLWTSSLGMLDLNTFLPALGLDLAGWTLASARGISTDGSAIVGYGTFNGADRAFLVKGLLSCGPGSGTGDGNADGATDGRDIRGMVNFQVAGDPVSIGRCVYDMNGDGIVNTTDIPLFVNVLIPS